MFIFLFYDIDIFLNRIRAEEVIFLSVAGHNRIADTPNWLRT